MIGLLYLLFFGSGLSGLIYQVVWVRVFGNVFGNTVYSTSLVVAVYMLGLGAGSYLVGAWADRRYAAFAEGFGPPSRDAMRGRHAEVITEAGEARRSSKERSRGARPESLLRAYGFVELVIGVIGLGISALLPHLGRVSALVTSYARDANGWYVLSTTSYLARVGISVILLAPITLLMGGTLTLLIRHLVRSDLEIGGRRIAVLYAVNTAGAALGCFVTDFALMPAFGLRGTEIVAVCFNVFAGVGALALAGSPARHPRWGALALRVPTVRLKPDTTKERARGVRLQADQNLQRDEAKERARGVRPSTSSGRPELVEGRLQAAQDRQEDEATDRVGSVRLQPDPTGVLAFAGLALGMSGFAAMGMEILWFRHFTILLGGFRAVFSLLLTVILIGVGAGSLASCFLLRRSPRLRSFELRRGSPKPSAEAVQPAQWLMVVQGLFVAFTLLGLASADASPIEHAVIADRTFQAVASGVVDPTLSVESGFARTFTELWFNLRPILLEVAVPALLMGFCFPLANAVIQRAERSVGRRAGMLYLSNTIGAVCGSLAAGFLLLPMFGIQGSATLLTLTAGLAIVPLYLAGRPSVVSGFSRTVGPPTEPVKKSAWRPPLDGPAVVRLKPDTTYVAALTGSLVVTAGALCSWLLLPSGYVITRAAPPLENERLLTVSEGLTEVITVVDKPGKGRTLVTNGHPMSSTARLSQRYMRALAHLPLLLTDNPETVLVIGFGVGNTTHAVTLHPSIRRVEVADLSRGILTHASYFNEVNRDVLSDPRVVVYVNDGRQHLHMQPPGSYDLITLEPPPIGYAGVAALYSTEFYALARTRLKPKGYISQWLPAYQVPLETTLAMIRAFVDVFPHAVLISGAEAELLLVGANDRAVEIDPDRLAAVLSRAPAVQADLERLDLGSVREIVGSFVGSAERLVAATRDTAPASDDRPVQEYGVLSLLNFGQAVPASVVDLSQVAAWCPRCFVDGKPVPRVEGLDTYLALLDRAYTASPVDVRRARVLAEQHARVIAGSAYLGAIVPESADLHNFLGIALAGKGELDEAMTEFREALRLDPDSAQTHWHLGAALASKGAREEAIAHLGRSVQLDASNGQARYDLGVVLLLQGKLDEAIDEFQRTLKVAPDFADARRNLEIALEQRRHGLK